MASEETKKPESFPDQYPGEVSIDIFRSNLISIIDSILKSMVLFALIIGVGVFLLKNKWVIIAGFVFCCFVLLRSIIIWRFNYGRITNQRLIIVSSRGLLNRDTTDISYGQIVFVRVTQGLFILFNFGNLEVHTLTDILLIKWVRHPNRTQNKISQTMSDWRSQQNDKGNDHNKDYN